MPSAALDQERLLTLFLPGEGEISLLIVYHVTTSDRNRVKCAAKVLIKSWSLRVSGFVLLKNFHL